MTTETVPERQTEVLELTPGETFVLFTDGVTEARSGRGPMLGTDGLRQTLQGLAGRTADEIAVAFQGNGLGSSRRFGALTERGRALKPRQRWRKSNGRAR